MKRVMLTGLLVAVLSLAGTSQARGPVTKQNGSQPAISAFTPICAVSGYADYGLCGGSAATFANVGGRMNAIQPKPGQYNLEFTFTGLTRPASSIGCGRLGTPYRSAARGPRSGGWSPTSRGRSRTS